MLYDHQRNEYALFLLVELVLIFDDQAFLFSPVRFLYPETPFLLTNLATATNNKKTDSEAVAREIREEKVKGGLGSSLDSIEIVHH